MPALTRSFCSQPMVLKVGGALLDDTAAQSAFLDAVAVLHRSHPGRLVLVHGGGATIERHCAMAGLATVKKHGVRVTPAEHMPTIAGALCGGVNAPLVAALEARGVRACGLRLLDAGLAQCERVDPALGVGEVGQVVGGDATVTHTMLAAGCLPVIASIGATRDGALLNVNADDAAAAVARILMAGRLILLTDVSGVRGPDGSVAPTLDAARIDEWIQLGIITGGMIPKVRGALAAAEMSGAPVVIASWRDPSALATALAGQPVGTLVHGGAASRETPSTEEVFA